MREVDLVSYLPPFLTDYEEINASLKAEDPEFRLVWNAAEKVLYNEFIATADEYGISRYEKMLDIYPLRDDTLESRRAKVQLRWISSIPYTERMLFEKLTAICGENGFIFVKKYNEYKIEIEVSMELFGQLEELENVIGTMIPCNMISLVKNKISYKIEETANVAGCISFTEKFCIVGDSAEYASVQMNNFISSGTTITECIEISGEE